MRRCCIIIVLTLPHFAAAVDPVWPAKVEARHLTHALARKYALTEAVRRITDYLQQLQPSLSEWKPTEEYVRENLISGPGSPGPDLTIDAGEQVKTWILKLKPPDLVEFRRLNQQALEHRWQTERSLQAQDRLALAGWAFAATATLLAAVTGYARVRGRRNAVQGERTATGS